MKKFSLLTVCAVCATLLQGAELIRRPGVIPGTSETPANAYENINLLPGYEKAGSLLMWVRPEGWNNDDKAWHFFCTQTEGKGEFRLYRFANGDTRMLVKNGEGKVNAIVAKIPFTSGKWTHLAIVWQRYSNGKYTSLKLYADGKLLQNRFCDFTFDGIPVKLRVGDIPLWRPYSKFKTTLGQVEVYDRTLSAEEIANKAVEKK